MNDVRELCDRMLAEPAPPRSSSAEILAVARRSAARRDRGRLGAIAAAVVAAAATPFVLVPDDGTPAPAPPAADAGVPVVYRASPAHGYRMAEVLAAALPAGVTVHNSHPDPDDTRTYRPDPVNPDLRVVVASAEAVVRVAGGAGRVTAALIAGPQTAGATSWVKRDAAGRVTNCVSSEVSGGSIIVCASQSLSGYAGPGATVQAPDPGPLAAPPLTGQQVAALAADPAMLP